MSKALKSNNKLLINRNKISSFVPTGTAGLGSHSKNFLIRNGRILVNQNNSPFFVGGLSQNMRDNSWSEIGNAIKHYREIGRPWEYGSQKKIKYIPNWGDYTSDPDYTVYETTVTLVGDQDVTIDGIDGHSYTFALPLWYYGAPLELSSNRSWDGWSCIDLSFFSFFSDYPYDNEEDDDTFGEWHQQPLCKAFVEWGSSISTLNDFGVASLRDLRTETARLCYYETIHALHPELQDPNYTPRPRIRPRPPEIFVSVPSRNEFLPLNAEYNKTSHIPPSEYYNGVEYSASYYPDPNNSLEAQVDYCGINVDWLHTGLGEKMDHILNVDGHMGDYGGKVLTRSLWGASISDTYISYKWGFAEEDPHFGNTVVVGKNEDEHFPSVIFFVVQAAYD